MNDAPPLEALDDGAPEAAYARFPRRLLATTSDGAVVIVGFAALFLAAAATGADVLVRVLLIAFVLVGLLYDPVLVSTIGGTLGHRWTNLRVVDDETGGNLPFGRAVLRSLIKSILGAPSFFVMAFTRRHQTVHDLASRSTVQVRDVSRARAYHYVHARAPETAPVGVSRRRRILVVIAYLVALYVVVSAAVFLVVPERCAVYNACSASDDLRFGVIGIAWVAAVVWVTASGWRGRLPGCRSR